MKVLCKTSRQNQRTESGRRSYMLGFHLYWVSSQAVWLSRFINLICFCILYSLDSHSGSLYL